MKASEPYYLKPLIRGVLVFLMAIMVWTWVRNIHAFSEGRADFSQLSTAGYMVRTGHAYELYDRAAQDEFKSAYVGSGAAAIPSNHPAYEALLFAPLTVFGYRVAYFLFGVLNVALLLVTYGLVRPRMGAISKIYPWVPAALFVAFLPIGIALLQGQDSILLLTLLAAAASALDGERGAWAGALVALGLFKFTITLPIGLLFFAWRRWRFAAAFALVGLCEVALSIALVGIKQSVLYVHSLRAMSATLSPSGQRLYGIDIPMMGNLRGFFFGMLNPAHISPATIQAVTVIASVAVLLWAAFAGRHRRQSDALMLAIVVAAVVSYHFLIHDMSVLFLPVVVMLNRYVEANLKDPGMVGRSAAVLFLAPSFPFIFPADYFFLACLPLCAFLFFLSRNETNSGPRAPGDLHPAATP